MTVDDEMLVIDGQELRLTHPDRVLYPVTGTSKVEVIEYYLRVAGAMLPHLAGRPATRKRWPDGVGGSAFFVKDLEPGMPVWLSRVQVRHRSGPKFYPVFDTPGSLAWLGQVAALELHVPQWRFGDGTGPRPVTSSTAEQFPDRVVFDLDPGEGAGLAECVEVAVALRERLGALGDEVVPVTPTYLGVVGFCREFPQVVRCAACRKRQIIRRSCQPQLRI